MSGDIIQIGDEVLRERAKPVAKKDITGPKVKALISRMKKALAHEKYGVAIAAPQLGESLRIFVVSGRAFEKEGDKDKNYQDKAYINPRITRRSKKKKEMSEGCLSVRGKYGLVLRHEKASLDALDETGKPVHLHAGGLLSQIFQHEIDHLEGILFVDKSHHLEDWNESKATEDSSKL
ncbi:MAG TPA: peptide deformylase [Candidatus Paceibacterota bacterium]|nr:peptide deformylase [Candidatus Paceibacterota bacterium]